MASSTLAQFRLLAGVKWTNPVTAAPDQGMAAMDDLNKNPKFWAVWAAIWLGLLLAIENIFTKIRLLSGLAE